MTARTDGQRLSHPRWRELCLSLLLVSYVGSAATAEAPQQVLTDTADYCAELKLQLDEALSHAGPPPQDVRILFADGESMCRNGEIKGGIVRLRRALMALRRGP